MYECGLVLEGGGLRGLYTVGILDFFMEKDIYFSDIYAVSAGALNGVSFVSKQIGRSKDINIKYSSDKRYLNKNNLFKGKPLFDLDFIVDDIPNKYVPFDFDRFYNSKSNFYCVSTNIETGKPEYFDIDDIRKNMDILKSTGSLPMFGKIIEVNDMKLLDGGISDSIPIRKAKEKNNKNVVILTRNSGYIKKKINFFGMHRLYYKKYPELIKAMENRHLEYNKTIEYINELENKKEIFVFRPTKPLEVDIFINDKDKLERLYLNGYNDAKEQYNNLIEFLEK